MRLATRSSKTSRVVGGALLALVAAGCSNGSEPASSNRGSGSDTTGTTVENAFIVPAFVPGRCAIQVDDGAELRFTVTNGSTTDPEQLLGLTTDAAKVAAIGTSTAIPPRGVVAFGQPSATQIDLAGRAPAARLDRLDPNLRPAMSTNVTFRFKRAGDVTLRVAVEACPSQAK